MAKANLVDRVDVILCGKRAETRHPDFFAAPQPVQQDYGRSLTSLDVVNVLAEDNSHFLGWWSGLVLREGERRNDGQNRGEQQGAEADIHLTSLWILWESFSNKDGPIPLQNGCFVVLDDRWIVSPKNTETNACP
jgi:hypothetical protein